MGGSAGDKENPLPYPRGERVHTAIQMPRSRSDRKESLLLNARQPGHISQWCGKKKPIPEKQEWSCHRSPSEGPALAIQPTTYDQLTLEDVEGSMISSKMGQTLRKRRSST